MVFSSSRSIFAKTPWSAPGLKPRRAGASRTTFPGRCLQCRPAFEPSPRPDTFRGNPSVSPTPFGFPGRPFHLPATFESSLVEATKSAPLPAGSISVVDLTTMVFSRFDPGPGFFLGQGGKNAKATDRHAGPFSSLLDSLTKDTTCGRSCSAALAPPQHAASRDDRSRVFTSLAFLGLSGAASRYLGKPTAGPAPLGGFWSFRDVQVTSSPPSALDIPRVQRILYPS